MDFVTFGVIGQFCPIHDRAYAICPAPDQDWTQCHSGYVGYVIG